MLNVETTKLPGLLVIEPETANDACGQVRPGFHPTQYAAFGMTGRFSSDRFVKSFQGSLRGLYTIPTGQNILLTVVRGDMCLVVVDLRANSRHFGSHQVIEITEAQNRQIYISGGMAYGYIARSAVLDLHEKYTGFFDTETFKGVFWKDPSLAIEWPVHFPLVADAEARFPSLKQFVPDKVFAD